MQDEPEPEDANSRDLVETGSAIGGGLIGLGATALGGPVLGSVLGASAQTALRRIAQRLLGRASGREEERIAFAAQVFAEQVQQRTDAGERLRDDGFLDGSDVNRSDGEELWEAMLRHVMTEYQERKISCRATMFASLLFRSDIDSDYAHYLVRLVDRLSYRQLKILAALKTDAHRVAKEAYAKRRAEYDALPDDQKTGNPLQRAAPIAADLAGEIDELGDLGLLGIQQPDGSVVATDAVWGSGSSREIDWGTLALSPMGETLYELMRLNETIPVEDVAATASAIASEG